MPYWVSVIQECSSSNETVVVLDTATEASLKTECLLNKMQISVLVVFPPAINLFTFLTVDTSNTELQLLVSWVSGMTVKKIKSLQLQLEVLEHTRKTKDRFVRRLLWLVAPRGWTCCNWGVYCYLAPNVAELFEIAIMAVIIWIAYSVGSHNPIRDMGWWTYTYSSNVNIQTRAAYVQASRPIDTHTQIYSDCVG